MAELDFKRGGGGSSVKRALFYKSTWLFLLTSKSDSAFEENKNISDSRIGKIVKDSFSS